MHRSKAIIDEASLSKASWGAGLTLAIMAIVMVYATITAKSSGGATPIFAIALMAVFLLTATQSFASQEISRSFRVLWPVIMVGFLYLIQGLTGELSAGVRVTAFVALVVFSFLVGRGVAKLNIPRLVPVAIIALAVIPGVRWVYEGNTVSQAGTAEGKNVVLGVIAHLSLLAFFLWARRSTSRGTPFVMILGIVGVMSAVLGLRVLLVACVFGILSFLTVAVFKVRRAHLALISLLLAAASYFVFRAVTVLATDPSLAAWNQKVTEWSGRRLDSGRDILWPTGYQAWMENFWFGVGPSTLPDDFGILLGSWHNSFLQVAIQVGVIGLLLLAVQVWLLLRMMNNSRSDRLVRAIGFGYISFTFFHAFSESFLISNSATIAIVVWMNLGILSFWADSSPGSRNFDDLPGVGARKRLLTH